MSSFVPLFTFFISYVVRTWCLFNIGRFPFWRELSESHWTKETYFSTGNQAPTWIKHVNFCRSINSNFEVTSCGGGQDVGEFTILMLHLRINKTLFRVHQFQPSKPPCWRNLGYINIEQWKKPGWNWGFVGDEFSYPVMLGLYNKSV